MKDVILEGRRAKGLTQKALADIVGVKQSTVCLWETGQCKPSVPTIKKLSEALEVPIEDFFKEEF